MGARASRSKRSTRKRPKTLTIGDAISSAHLATSGNLGSVARRDAERFTDSKGKHHYGITEAREAFRIAFEKTTLISEATQGFREALFNSCVPVYVHKGDLVYRQGEYGQIMYIVLDATIVVATTVVEKRRRRRRKVLGDDEQLVEQRFGDILAEHSVILNSVHDSTAKATKQGFLLAIHRLQYESAAVAYADSREIDAKRSKFGKSISLFEFFDETINDSIAEVAVLQSFASGAVLCSHSDVFEGMHVVVSGQVVLKTPGHHEESDDDDAEDVRDARANIFPNEENREVKWFGLGDVIGEHGLLGVVGPIGVDVVCSGPVETLYLPFAKIEEVLGAEGVAQLNSEYLSKLLSKAPLLANLDADELDALRDEAELLDFDSEESVRDVGEDAAIYFVVGGAVKVEPHAEEDAEMRAARKSRAYATLTKQLSVMQGSMKGFSSTPTVDLKSLSSTGKLLEAAAREGSDKSAHRSLGGALLKTSSKTLENVLGLHPNAMGGSADNDAHRAVFRSDYAVLSSGDAFGEESLRDSAHARSSFIALGSCRIARISLKAMDSLGVLDAVLSADEEHGAAAPLALTVDGPAEAKEEPSESLRHLSSRFKLKSKAVEGGGVVGGLMQSSDELRDATMGRNRLHMLRKLHQTDLTEVWLAMHVTNKQLLVVKGLNVDVANARGMGNFVFAEQAVLAQLSSPFVSAMVCAWEEPSVIFVGLSPSLGGDMEDLLKACLDGDSHKVGKMKKSSMGGLPLEVVRFCAACVGEALKHLYEHSVVHRDVKPANAILDHRGYIQLVDFGISKQLPPGNARTSTFIGTPKYMSPELARVHHGQNQGYGFANDWWALGVMLWELSTGVCPFEPNDGAGTAASFQATFKKIQNFGKNVENARGDALNDLIVKSRKAGAEGAALVSFLEGLLTPAERLRLGCGMRGPRGALSHPYIVGGKSGISALDLSKLRAGAIDAPFIPIRLIVDFRDIEKAARETEHLQSTHAFEGAGGGVNSKRATLETKFRGELESNPTGPMANEVLNTERARRQLMMARQQQLKRAAYKSGRLDFEGATGQQGLRLRVLNKAAFTDAMHSHLVSGTRKRMLGMFGKGSKDVLKKSVSSGTARNVIAEETPQDSVLSHPGEDSDARQQEIMIKATITIQRMFRRHKKRRVAVLELQQLKEAYMNQNAERIRKGTADFMENVADSMTVAPRQHGRRISQAAEVMIPGFIEAAT